VPILPLYGHEALRRRLRQAVERGTLPASLLLHGPRGIGKQRLALWLGQLLLCTGTGELPCGTCQSCGYALQLAHPDLRWFFPRPKNDGAEPIPREVLDEYAEASAERAKEHGLYARPGGTEALYLSVVRGIVQHAGYSPALSSRKVIVIGDADRMVPQEANQEAANAFLKLLEEPLADTTIILTTSESGMLLPTIRSRVAALRVAPIAEREVRAWLAQSEVKAALEEALAPKREDARVDLAAGAPGSLLAASAREDAVAAARAVLDAASADRATQIKTVFAMGGKGARGAFTDTLDALTVLLHQRSREAVLHNDPAQAVAASRAIDAVQETRLRTGTNVSPQLLGAALMRRLTRNLA